MKKLLGLIFFFYSYTLFGQSYWQQEVNYKIDVALDDRNHSLKGFLKLAYTNNSPDKLDFIWFHLWPNAYKDENTAFAKQLLQDRAGKKRLQKITDKGYMDSLSFSVNNEKLETEANPEYIDIVKVNLKTPLAPGATVEISTPFYVKLPTYNSRMGYDEQSFMICQWYPKPAVYDRKGWHPIPYLDQGEFYSEFGSFTVNITVPSAYLVAATGVLQNQSELEQYKAMGIANVQKHSNKNQVAYNPGTAAEKTLQFKGEKIHDFAWFTDKNFVVRYDIVELQRGDKIDIFSWHHPDGNKNWKYSTDYIRDAVTSYSTLVGDYPYPVVQAVEGPKNDMSGGMEYPMITLITSPKAGEPLLDAVIAHEVGHNWFYGILGSNERTHPWMDEGINTYYQFLYEAKKYNNLSMFGDAIPAEVRNKPMDEFLDMVYKVIAQQRMWEPIETPAADFKDEESYGLVEYMKTAVWMHMMEAGIGKWSFLLAMRTYYDQWKFRHPYPEDLEESLEKTLGKSLDEYFVLLKKKGNLQ